jgi:hypothetical protein
MKRILLVAALVAVLTAVGAVAAFAAPGAPGRAFGATGPGFFGMMGGTQGEPYGHMGGSGMMGGAQGAPYGYGHMGDGSMMADDLEKLLGIDHADIHAAHVAGKSLVEIAAEKGVSEDQLIETILAGRKAALQQAVEAGKLTQVSADQMLKFMETNIKTMVEAKGVGAMMSEGGMMGQGGARHMGGMMGGAPDADDATGSGSCHGGQAPAQQGTSL